jgi:hypothetical protein
MKGSLLGKKTLSFFCFFVLTSTHIKATGDVISIHQLLVRLAQLQAKSDPYFPDGLFPSWRSYQLNKKRLKADDNIFFTGLTAFTLRRIRTYLNDTDRSLCDSILERVRQVAAKYKNITGRDTYNFWPTDRPKIFPNSGLLNRFDKKLTIADDLDDTSIMLLALNAPDSTVQKVHAVMQTFINGREKRVKTTLREYGHMGAYSCWFGKKMAIELDACVMANILYLVQDHQLAWTKADSASLGFIVKMIERNDLVKHPDKMSVYYKTTSIILYHLARLMSVKSIHELEQYKPKLIGIALDAYKKAATLPEKIILRTALLHWNVNILNNPIVLNSITQVENQPSFVFFVANLACTLPGWLAFPLFNSGLTHFSFYSPVYNDVLLLEYLIEQKKFDAR